MLFFPPTVESGTALRIEIDKPFSLENVELLKISDAPVALEFNPIALIVLAVSIVGLLLVEKKLGYFAWLRALCVDKLTAWRELLNEGKRRTAILCIASTAVTMLTLLFIGSLILFGVYSALSLRAAFICTAIAVLLQLLSRILSGKGDESAKLFLVLAVLTGLMMCYAMPPSIYVAWDDETHFRRAFDLMHLFSDERPMSYFRILIHQQYPLGEYAKDPAAYVSAILQGSDIMIGYHPGLSHPYSAFGYIPSMMTMVLLPLLGADVVRLVVLCRLANVLAYSLIIYLGIRKLRSGAYLFSAICLLPSAFFLACSISYDYWITAWFAYAFATLFSVLQDKDRTFQTSDLVKILVAFFIGCGPKAIYCFMMLPLFFLKKQKFENPQQAKKFRMWTAITVGFMLATLIVPALIVPDLYTDTRGGSDVSTGGQIAFILSHPFQYASILLDFLGEYVALSQLNIAGSFYAYLGYSHPIIGTLAGCLLFYCIFTDRREGDGYATMQTFRWLTVFVTFAQMVLIATSLYVGFTPVGHETVNGCQYRYIFPLLLPFCFFLAPKGLRSEISRKLQNSVVFGGLAISLLGGFFSVLITTL